jgi:gliding motility-associated-like protein
MKRILPFLLLLCYSLNTFAQLPACNGIDSNVIFIDNGSTIHRFDPALPISGTNPSLFITSTLSMAGLAIANNINGGSASPTFYTTSNGVYQWWDGSAWVNTGHTSSTVNIGGATTAIYGKNGGTGFLSKYVGTGNDFFLVNGLANSGPYDLVGDQSDNFYEVDISTAIGKIYKRNPAGAIIDTFVVLNVPAQTAGPGFAIIGNRVFLGVNTAPAVWSGNIINDTVNCVALGTFANSGGDYASCPKVTANTTTASLVYPTCNGPVNVGVTSPMLTTTATVLWNFGDPASGINNTSTLNNTTHTFSGNGTYTVTTYITGSLGNDTVVNIIVVNNTLTGSSSISICAPATYQGHSVSGVYIDTFQLSAVCDSIHTLNLTVNPEPTFSLGPDLPLCANNTTTLSAGTGWVSVVWDDFSTATTRTVTTPGTYYCTVTNANSCSKSDTIVVFADTTLNADFQMIVRLGCDDDTVEFVNTSSGATQYIWFFGDSQSSLLDNPTHVYTNQMAYTVTLVAANPPCYDTISYTVDVSHPITANLFASGNGGINGSSFHQDSTCILYDLDVLSTSFPVGSYVYDWTWGDGTNTNSGNTPNAKHFYTTPGTYTVTLTITDTIGCQDDSSRVIYVDDLAYVDITASDSIVCVGEPIIFHDSTSLFLQSFEYDFADGAILSNVHHPVHTYDREGSYIVTVTARSLICPDSSDSKTIIVDEYPVVDLGKDTSICPGITGTIFLNNVANPAGVYEWSTGETANLIQVVEPGYYWIRAESANAGCTSTDSIRILRDCYINIPNAFSPDGDGLNDYFFPRDLLSSGVTVFKMNIYNRWGENIFTTDKIDGRGWDGKYDGKLQNMGVYVYTIDVTFANKVKKSYKGNVTLVR